MNQEINARSSSGAGISAPGEAQFRARVIAVSCGKGGVGKSTTSICLSAALSRPGRESVEGERVVLVDADVQRAATSWVDAAQPNVRLPFDVLSLASAGRSLPMQLEPLARVYDWIVIDCPPSLSDAAMAALLCAHVVISPVRPCAPDLRAVVDTISMVNRAREVSNPGLAHRILINMDKNTAVATSVKNVLASCGAPIMASRLGDRTAFQRAAAMGSVPAAMGSACRVAAQEVDRMVEELKSLFQGDLHDAR